MKKKYSDAYIEIIELLESDIITDSFDPEVPENEEGDENVA